MVEGGLGILACSLATLQPLLRMISNCGSRNKSSRNAGLPPFDISHHPMRGALKVETAASRTLREIEDGESWEHRSEGGSQTQMVIRRELVPETEVDRTRWTEP
jgi:hypothetical protein